MEEKIVLYSTGCPRCRVLKKKLDDAGLKYSVIDDIDEIEKAGFMYVPVLNVYGASLDFEHAIRWIKAQTAEGESV